VLGGEEFALFHVKAPFLRYLPLVEAGAAEGFTVARDWRAERSLMTVVIFCYSQFDSDFIKYQPSLDPEASSVSRMLRYKM